ncbi:hypothetical protein O9X99_01850 [Agrobacterium salinitolerans]|uniref:Uncharacterized protein n=1 Tax=Agrobacterium salinitolerans TaxID=1183413 RepID=A0ABY3BV05_9HYPH|nr:MULTISPECIES: hypothetical protein [Agrobacterium]MCZ7890410.1 hypothetical protein [Agrobacterium salinitolerans]TRA96867.1 hypothetical protein EXN23_01100 [Agrobacterium salinitolerans]
MAQHRSVPCPAQAVATQTGAIFSVLAAGAVSAHMNGVAAARQAREDRNSHILAYQVQEASMAAHEWADLARAQAIEIERLKAENSRLTKVAKQNYELAQRLSRKAA